MGFPEIRMRRLRKNDIIRAMVRETRLHQDHFIMPLFVCTGKRVRKPIQSMPGNFQLSEDELIKEVNLLLENGIHSLLLFGIPDQKDEEGRIGYSSSGIIQKAVRKLKKEFKEQIYIITDVCNCEYTTHGHCGPIIDDDVDNDKTLEILARQALSHAQAGGDMVAPSDMMDGRIQKIRNTLDSNGFNSIPILSYAAKYASAFYGPFRDAAESAPQFGNRNTYQMDPANADEAIREVALDIEEGADLVMVKPALSYLDIIRRIKEHFHIPLVAYNVSGEFSMVKAAAEKNWIDEKRIIMEILTAIKRAGADLIITYHALEAAKFLSKQSI